MGYRENYEAQERAESMRHFRREMDATRAFYNPNPRKAKKTLVRILDGFGIVKDAEDDLYDAAWEAYTEDVLECAASFCRWGTPTPRWFYGGGFAGFTRWCESEDQEDAPAQAWQLLLAFGGPAYGFYAYVSTSGLSRVYWFYSNWGYSHASELTGRNAEAVLSIMRDINPDFPLQ